MANVKFDFSGFHIFECRSPNTDTDYASLSVRVGDKLYGPKTKYVGDLDKGDHGVGLTIIAEVPSDNTQVVVAWAVINSDDGDEALNIVGNLALGLVGAALTEIPFIGTVLAAIFAVVVNPWRNHNGPCVLQQCVTTGALLGQVNPLNSSPGETGAKNFGRDFSPGGGDSSNYTSIVWVTGL